MKTCLMVLLLGCLFLITGCESRTEYGSCIGLGDDRDPSLRYKASTQNIIIGVIFFEMIAPPIIVAVDEFYCPVGRKKTGDK